MSSGEKYEVTHHDAALVTRNWLEIGFNTDKEGIAESVARCSILHIAQIEDHKRSYFPADVFGFAMRQGLVRERGGTRPYHAKGRHCASENV